MIKTKIQAKAINVHHLDEKKPDSTDIFEPGKQWIAPCSPYLDIVNSSTQTRITLDRSTVSRYGKLMFEGNWDWMEENDSIVLFWDSKKKKLYCGDGHHRIMAALEQHLHQIYVEIRFGNLLDATIYNCVSNSSHGKQTTTRDKQNQIEILLVSLSQLPENDYRRQWSQRKIARAIGVDHKTVSRVMTRLYEPRAWQELLKKEEKRKKQKVFYNFRKLIYESDLRELKEYLKQIDPQELSKLKSAIVET